MNVSLKMVAGVDLWLNTPKRPLEASGTSGMKATHNGVPSLSIPDGWWVEGLIEGVTGWGIGQEILTETDPNKIDEMDANDLYEKLEKQIIPMYYNDPMAYVVIMRNAIAINAAYFNTHRMVNQYLVGAYARNHMV
jgi:starch phosphorylase